MQPRGRQEIWADFQRIRAGYAPLAAAIGFLLLDDIATLSGADR